MKLAFVDHDKLYVDPRNMRHSKKKPDCADLLPSVRKHGVLVPLVVLPPNAEGMSGILAGNRRWNANESVLAEGIDHGPLPCAIREEGDDADAIEISLIENVARRDPDEVTQWETFSRLVKEGRGIADISATFGFPELGVKRILALGNLLPRIRDLYRKEKISRGTVTQLTMATKGQQRDWLALFDDPKAHCPTDRLLKDWLFGGTSIAVKHALFDTEGMTGIVADLFGEDAYFADSDTFWSAQNAAIEARQAAYLADGWTEVVIVPPGEHFSTWEHSKAPKEQGGRIYIDVSRSGEVVFREGYVTEREAKKLAKGGAAGEALKVARPEVSGTMLTYLVLHRHAAVRAALLAEPGVALRLMVAHVIGGSSLWSVKVEEQSTRNAGIAESVETCRGEVVFDERRRAVLALLDRPADQKTVTQPRYDNKTLAGVFLRLLALSDDDVMAVLAVVMGETLAAGSPEVEAVGQTLSVDMAAYWQADDAFYEAIRDKEVLLAIVTDVAGPKVAAANRSETGKTLKTIICDTLSGAGGRAKREGWVPKWMTFPPTAYTKRGGVGTVAKAQAVAKARAAIKPPEPAPETPEVVETPLQIAA